MEISNEATPIGVRTETIGEKAERGACLYSGPGRGDCEHFVGLPGYSISGQHDGPDDTVDCYGKPNGWCWSCWWSYRANEAENRAKEWREAAELILQYSNPRAGHGAEYTAAVQRIYDLRNPRR